MDNSVRRGTWEMVFAMLISGTIGWFVLASQVPLVEVVFWRCVIGGVTLAAVCKTMGYLSIRLLTLRTLGLGVLSGVAIVGNWLLLFGSYSKASIAIGTAVYNVQPFILVVLAAVFLGEKVTLKKLAWLSVAFLGMLAIASAHGDQQTSAAITSLVWRWQQPPRFSTPSRPCSSSATRRATAFDCAHSGHHRRRTTGSHS